jgi:hypothetical protein
MGWWRVPSARPPPGESPGVCRRGQYRAATNAGTRQRIRTIGRSHRIYRSPTAAWISRRGGASARRNLRHQRSIPPPGVEPVAQILSPQSASFSSARVWRPAAGHVSRRSLRSPLLSSRRRNCRWHRFDSGRLDRRWTIFCTFSWRVLGSHSQWMRRAFSVYGVLLPGFSLAMQVS